MSRLVASGVTVAAKGSAVGVSTNNSSILCLPLLRLIIRVERHRDLPLARQHSSGLQTVSRQWAVECRYPVSRLFFLTADGLQSPPPADYAYFLSTAVMKQRPCTATHQHRPEHSFQLVSLVSTGTSANHDNMAGRWLNQACHASSRLLPRSGRGEGAAGLIGSYTSRPRTRRIRGVH
jgi:hypothetical protein